MSEAGVATYKKDAGTMEVVEFKFGEKTFGIDLHLVQEIVHAKKIIKIPKSHPFISGMVDIKGAAIPAVNLEKLTGESPEYNPKLEKMISIRLRDHSFVFRVDQVIEVRTIEKPQIENRHSDYITYMVERESDPLFIIDLERIVRTLEVN